VAQQMSGCIPLLSRNFQYVGLYWRLQKDKAHLSVLIAEVLKLTLATTMDYEACTPPKEESLILYNGTFLLHT
jgi:hypothetical protein